MPKYKPHQSQQKSRANHTISGKMKYHEYFFKKLLRIINWKQTRALSEDLIIKKLTKVR